MRTSWHPSQWRLRLHLPETAPCTLEASGLALDITTELFLPATTSIPQLDRMNTIWWIVVLMRLHATTSISVPVISSERYASIPVIQQDTAAFLEPSGRDRYACFKKVKELYDSRSKAAHGGDEPDLKPYAETYAVKQILLNMIETRHVPDKKEFEANLFGDPIGITSGPADGHRAPFRKAFSRGQPGWVGSRAWRKKPIDRNQAAALLPAFCGAIGKIVS